MAKTSTSADWKQPTRIRLGRGRIQELGSLFNETAHYAPMIVTDKALATSPAVKKLMRQLDKTALACGVFSQVDNLATTTQLSLGCELFLKGDFDSILAFGDSNVIDFAKLVAHRIGATVIAVPVTAGAGAEVMKRAFYCDLKGNTPSIRYQETDLPKFVIYDPEIAAAQSTKSLASSAFAILAQAIEAWCAPSFDPVSDALAIEATQYVLTYLPQILNNSYDLEAQSRMMSAAVMAAMAAKRGQGATAALTRTLSLLFRVPYGITAGLLLPHVMAFNSAEINSRIAELADRLGIKGGPSSFAHLLLKLRRNAGVPSKLSALIQQDKLRRKDKILIDQIATGDPASETNPTRFTQKAAFTILDSAMAGKMKRQ